MQLFYLGSDASKGYSDFVILDEQKEVVLPNFQLDDTFDGHAKLYQILYDFLKERPDARIHAAVESTGGYENNWLNLLVSFQASLNLKTARLNPLPVKANVKAAFHRNKTDAISAFGVADYLISHPKKVVFFELDPTQSLRKQWTFLTMLIKQRTQLYNQLETLLYSANTEILTHCKDGTPQWVLKLLLRYPTAPKLARARAVTLASIPYITPARAAELIAEAKRSVASQTDAVTEQLVTATVQQVQHLTSTINHQEKLLARQCSEIPEINLLKSFSGIGDHSAVGLLLEIQTIKRFATVKKLACYFGLHPVYKASGDGVGKVKMSKQGRKQGRAILYMVAMTAIRTNPHIQELYQKHVDEGMEKMAAIGVCMHKILRIVYGMLKNEQPYDPQVDRRNRKRSQPKATLKRPDTTRRYQAMDARAPVSKRQHNKRLQVSKSHSDSSAIAGSKLNSQPQKHILKEQHFSPEKPKITT